MPQALGVTLVSVTYQLDAYLGGGLHATTVRGNSWQPACDAWKVAAPSHIVPTPRVALRSLPCPRAAADAYVAAAPAALIPPPPLASSIVCRGVSSSFRRPPTYPTGAPRLALLLGGLARTFARPLVHSTLRANLIEALGFGTSGVFAHLRLEDRRGITGFGKIDLSGVTSAERAEVEAALASLGAQPEDVKLVYDSTPPVPECAGWPKPVALPKGEICKSYALPCSFHAMLGQLWSRKEL